MTRFLQYGFSDPGMLNMYLITGTYYSEWEDKKTGIVHHF